MERRFSGVARLYGQAALTRFSQAHVCVIGVGGVGSWAAEALARSGIGKLTFIDLDHVAESNVNRQLQALENDFGKPKVLALKERVAQINADAEVITVEDFVSADNLEQLIDNDFDYVLDCIDSFRTKAALIHYCWRQKINVITLGGAGGKIDPTKIGCTDFYKTEQDPLLAQTRRLLRQKYGFSKNPKRRFGIKAVWSIEPPVMPEQNDECGIGTHDLNCAGFGSAMTVTASFAMLAVAQVLKYLTEQATPD